MIEALKPYAEYKESGVPWLGKVPEHWRKGPGFAAFREKQVKNTGMREKTVLSLSYGRIVIKPPEKLHGLVPESFETYQIVEPGDIIIRSTDLQNDWNSLRVGLVRDQGIITSAYLCFKTTDTLIPEYGYLLLHAFDLMKIFYGLGSGLRQNLSFIDFKRMVIFVPPVSEQSAIMWFIDHANRKIDHFIRSKRRLIELLNEQKHVIINQAVTKGLDPDVPMKNSGVGWLGTVPEHWQLKRLKFICRFAYGDSLSAENRNDGEVSVFGSNGIVGKHSEANTNAPCIIVGRKGSYGKVNYSYFSGFAIDTTYFIDKTQTDSELRWLYYALQCLGLDTISQDTCIPGLSRESAYCNTVPYIEKNEQLVIASFLDRETTKLDSLIATTRDAIALIREYRTRLISDVVTGKLDVRGVVIPTMDKAETLEDIEIAEDIETEAQDLIESEEVADADQ